MGRYLRTKGFNPEQFLAHPLGKNFGHVEKAEEHVYLTVPQFHSILEAITADKNNNPSWRRDWYAIYFGFYLALRSGEAGLLERNNFRMLNNGKLMIRTLKIFPKAECICRKCNRRVMVSSLKISKKHRCASCGALTKVGGDAKFDRTPPEMSVTIMEREVLQRIRGYMNEAMGPDQRWFFEPEKRPGTHISPWTAEQIFALYARKAGLPPEYSWHSLRHGRGVYLYKKTKDPKVVQNVLRHKDAKTSQLYIDLDAESKAQYSSALDAGYTDI
jgi:integrase